MDIRKTDEFETWIRSLRDATARMRIDLRVVRLGLGNAGDSAPVGAGVSELRIHYGPGYRVYYVRRGSAWVLLLGGDKSTQQNDIKRALALAGRL